MSKIQILSDSELAAWQEKKGARVVRFAGYYWEEVPRGFWRPVNWLGRHKDHEIGLPRLGLGYRAALLPGYEMYSNGSIPVHLMQDVSVFSIDSLGQMQTRNLKKCRKMVETVVLGDPELLFREGHDVVSDSLKRMAHRDTPTKEAYIAGIKKDFEFGKPYIIAGLVEGRLAGYIYAYAVQGIYYVMQVFTKTEYLKTAINTGLMVDAIISCQEAGVRELVHGLHTPENPSLTEFKVNFGLPVVQVPALVHLNPIANLALKYAFPYKHYRLCGILRKP